MYEYTKLAGSTYSTITPFDLLNAVFTHPIPIVVISSITLFLVKWYLLLARTVFITSSSAISIDCL